MESKLVIFVAFATLLQTALVSGWGPIPLGVAPVKISVPLANAEAEAVSTVYYTAAVNGPFKLIFASSGSLADRTTTGTADQADVYKAQSLADYKRGVNVIQNSVKATDGFLSESGAAAVIKLNNISSDSNEAIYGGIARTVYQGDQYGVVKREIEALRNGVLAKVPAYSAANVALILNGNKYDEDVTSSIVAKKTEYEQADKSSVNGMFDAIQQLLKNLFVDRSITSGDFGNLRNWQSQVNTAIADKSRIISEIRVIKSEATAVSE